MVDKSGTPSIEAKIINLMERGNLHDSSLELATMKALLNEQIQGAGIYPAVNEIADALYELAKEVSERKLPEIKAALRLAESVLKNQYFLHKAATENVRSIKASVEKEAKLAETKALDLFGHYVAKLSIILRDTLDVNAYEVIYKQIQEEIMKPVEKIKVVPNQPPPNQGTLFN